MRAQQVTALTGPDGLQPREVAEPERDGHVLIDVAAAGVSFPDLLLSRGTYQMRPPLPFTPGVEVAGTVRWAPDGSALAPGTRVMAFTMLGGFADVAAADPALTVAVPEQLDLRAAAGFLMNYHTVHFALARRARVARGAVVAVHGAGGGVGTAAVQVAKGLGAHVIALTSSDEKAAVAQRAGADEVIDVRGDWAARLREQNGGRGADVILDPVGGDRFDESVRCLAPEGRIVVVGFTEGRIPSVQVNRVLFRNIDVVGAAWGAFLGAEPALFARTQAALDPMIAAGTVAPIIGATYALEDTADALRALEERRALGKLVVEVRPGVSVVIRTTTEDDWRVLREVRLAALRDAPQAFLDSIDAAEAFPDSLWQERARVTMPYRNFLAWADGAAVAMTAVRLEGEPAEVVSVWVRPEHRRRGIAQSLIETALEHARATGHDRAALWVLQGNVPARTLYERLGFTPTGRTKPMPWGDGIEDEMEIRLRR